MLIHEKVSQAFGILKEFHIDCWLTFVRETQINGDPSLPFLVGSDLTWHSAFVITSSGEARAIVGQYDRKTVEETGAYKEVTGYVQGIKEPLLNLLRSLNPSTIAVNYSEDSEICDGLTHGMYCTLHRMLSEIGFQNRLISAEPVVSALRQRKTATEIAHIRDAIRLTEEIFTGVRGFIAAGRTEREIAAFMKHEVERAGVDYAWDPTGCPAVFTGPDTAEAHYAPTDRKVEPGHIMNMDFGLKVNGYCSDLQRTFYILEKGEVQAPPEVQRGFETIVNAIELSRTVMRPGVKGHEVDAVARRVVVSSGYKEFPHGLGHQVGRFSHDGTALLGPPWEKYAKKPFEPLEESMVFTLEPRLTVDGRGIATVEEMVVVTHNGAEFLSTPQRELVLIHS